MLQGQQADTFALLLAGAALSAAFVLVVRARPQLAVVTWALTIAFVPYWLGVSAGAAYVPPAALVAGLAVVALIGLRGVRLRSPDAIVAAVVVLTVIAAGLGFVTVHALSVVVVDWGLAYLLARMVGALVGLEWVYGVVAGVLAVAGALAVFEFFTGTNLFVDLGPPSGLHASWGALQERGGVLRAEGAFGHSIALGVSLALAVPLTLGSALRFKIKMVFIGVLVAGVILSFSRIAIGTAVLGLVLAILLLRSAMRPRARVLLAVVFGIVAMLAMPVIGQVFDAAGEEAAGSAAYRSRLWTLLPSIRVLGTASSAERTADGTLHFGEFRSIDSALLYSGLVYGWLVMVLLGLLYLAGIISLLRRASAPGIAVVAQLPAVLSVALITQYAPVLWFVIGLAVSARAERVVPGARRPLRSPRSVGMPRLGARQISTSPQAVEGEGHHAEGT